MVCWRSRTARASYLSLVPVCAPVLTNSVRFAILSCFHGRRFPLLTSQTDRISVLPGFCFGIRGHQKSRNIILLPSTN
jgi:hypothetical protein